MKKSSTTRAILMMGLAMGAMGSIGGMGGTMRRSISAKKNLALPKGFKEYWFDRETGMMYTAEEIHAHNSNALNKKINGFRVTARTSEQAKKTFEKKTKKGKR